MSTVVEKPDENASECLFCKSTGVCGKCEGRGVRPTMKGRRRIMVDCNACDGGKVCPLCHGKGVVSFV